MSLGEPLRIDDGVCLRQCGRQGVVVGDHHVNPARVGIVNRLVFADAGVAGEDHVCALVDQALQVGQIDPVPRAETVGDVVSHLRARSAQRRDEQGGGRLPIDVEIAPDGDQLALPDGAAEALDGTIHVGQVER